MSSNAAAHSINLVRCWPSSSSSHTKLNYRSWPPFQMFLTAGKTSSTSKLCVHNCQPHPPRQQLPSWFSFFPPSFTTTRSDQQLPSWFSFFLLLSPPPDQYQMCTTVTHILLHHLDFICTITTTSISIWLFGSTKPKPDFCRQGLDWIVGQDEGCYQREKWKTNLEP